mgnify:FL=1
MQYNVKKWGLLPDGTMCHIIQLSYNDISLYVSDYGATFQSMFVTDSSGTQHDIILGYDTPEEYYYDQQNFGGTMGRFANRIAGACITLNGKDWHLPANEGNNTFTADTASTNVCGSMMLILRLSFSHFTARILRMDSLEILKSPRQLLLLTGIQYLCIMTQCQIWIRYVTSPIIVTLIFPG